MALWYLVRYVPRTVILVSVSFKYQFNISILKRRYIRILGNLRNPPNWTQVASLMERRLA